MFVFVLEFVFVFMFVFAFLVLFVFVVRFAFLWYPVCGMFGDPYSIRFCGTQFVVVFFRYTIITGAPLASVFGSPNGG